MGPVEQSVRAALAPGSRLPTPTGRGNFELSEYTNAGMVLLLGAEQARTVIPWAALEGVQGFLRGRSWVTIGSVFDTEAREDTFDSYLKGFVNRATAGW